MINAMKRNGSKVSVVSRESLSEITSEIHNVPPSSSLIPKDLKY